MSKRFYLLLFLLLTACTAVNDPAVEMSTAENANPVYLPLVSGGRLIKVGAEYESEICPYLDLMHPIAPVKISIRWDVVEAERGVYDWSSVDDKLCGVQADWISIKNSPAWAVKIGRPICKLPREECYPDAARFYQMAIDRYQPKQVGIWNEPDAYFELMPPGAIGYYGCLGNEPEEYGRFVKYIDQRIHNTEIVIGEVANPHWPFLAIALEHAEGYYDGVSFHCYPAFRDGEYDTQECQRRYNDVRALVVDVAKPIYNSETALYYVSGAAADYYQGQVALFDSLRNLPALSFWYTGGYNGWPASLSADLLNHDLTPRPVWYAYIEQ